MNISDAIFEISAAAKKQFVPPDLPEIVFVGRSNVGKSSLLNMLCNRRQLAKVSSTPGKTQMINFFKIRLSQKLTDAAGKDYPHIRFVDLPGYGYAKVSQQQQQTWAKLIQSYVDAERPISLIIVLVDSRLPLQENDAAILDLLIRKHFPVQVVLTKADKLSQSERAQQERRLAAQLNDVGVQYESIFVSSKTGHGKKELLQSIADSVESEDILS